MDERRFITSHTLVEVNNEYQHYDALDCDVKN